MRVATIAAILVVVLVVVGSFVVLRRRRVSQAPVPSGPTPTPIPTPTPTSPVLATTLLVAMDGIEEMKEGGMEIPAETEIEVGELGEEIIDLTL
jgi:hypothetical protein